MLILAVVLLALLAGAKHKPELGTVGNRPRLGAIEKCDGSGKMYFGGQQSPGQEWFSLEGRVADSNGNPVCGAEVSARYSELLGTTDGSIRGASSPTGVSGEFFVANLRKGIPFTVQVNPFHKLEHSVSRMGIEALADVLKVQRNARSSGLARYRSDELKHTGQVGVMRLDIILPEDSTAAGIILGDLEIEGPLDVNAPAVVHILAAGREPIDVPVERLTGRFVALGVPVGQHEVKAEVTARGRRYRMSNTVTVAPGKDSVAKVQLRPN